MNAKTKKSGLKARCLLIVGILLAGFTACSDNDGDSQGGGCTSGSIIATGNTALTSHALSGAVLLPVDTKGIDTELSPDKFTYENLSITGEMPLDDATMTDGKLPIVTAVGKGTESDYVLTFGYDYTGYTSCLVSFTLGYEGTDTSIPVSITIEDGIRSLNVAHLGSGLSGLLSWESNPEAGEMAAYNFIDLEGIGAHADHLSLKKLDNEYAVALDDLFEFTTEEIAQGYASIPVQATWKCTNGTEFLTYDTFSVCPSRILEQVTIGSEETKHVWDVKEAVEALGMDKHENGNIYVTDRDAKYYISTKEGALGRVGDFGYLVVPGVGMSQSNENYSPTISLTMLHNLPAGEYIYVVHLKKLRDPNDHQYVDIRMPFVKE